MRCVLASKLAEPFAVGVRIGYDQSNADPVVGALLKQLAEHSGAQIEELLSQIGLGKDETLPYFALLTASFPQLVSVPRDSLLADASEEELPRGVQMRVLLGEQSALLPDLEGVERMIGEALSAVA